MKKVLLVGLSLLLPFAALAGVKRNPVLEVISSVYCYNCPGAAMAAEAYREEFGKRAVVIEYPGTLHDNPFQNVASRARQKYYNVDGFPTSIVDGVLKQVGGHHTISIYKGVLNLIKPKVQKRMTVNAPISIKLSKTLNLTKGYLSSSVKLVAKIANEDNRKITGRVHFAIVENHIPFKWEGRDSLYWLERSMNNNASGETITLNIGEDVVMEHEFHIDPKWYETTNNPANFELVCFMQNDKTKEIYQGAWIPMVATSVAEYNPKLEDNSKGFSLNIPEIISDNSKLALSISSAADVDVVLFDVAGRAVKTLYSGTATAGLNIIPISANDMPEGVYFIKTTVGTKSDVEKVLVVH